MHCLSLSNRVFWHVATFLYGFKAPHVSLSMIACCCMSSDTASQRLCGTQALA